MTNVTVSQKGQVVIPIEIRKRLGIKPGCKLSFSLDGESIRVELQRPQSHTDIDEGFGMLVCPPTKPRFLKDFDVAQAMQEQHDRG
ncbi:AbrB/MazE/SpoVT family DNA-binding domain-containing protein [Synechocystis sp. PCC 7339]|uniref:AbrB/MazE/SpoVT family DNA-binding domain-containing protein n=1 Tax=unclassified Synechocystis TaxID=2640012 RepID=UPI001BB0C422|nr:MULTISPECIES: AbrB/MazE/SpoVT family DNA-binding domain-containing protein [unclassified Synechocystis]QUS59951.1 AbrB/MazE/SpoVT family DNA-binding domain-containing protein [Synechocystis sp. PCC 7338]UAJ72592.1 AbrB/MazE/SpoVT family DNA-binding domain-containing protein [Synechocystis sp. PCC 7339]